MPAAEIQYPVNSLPPLFLLSGNMCCLENGHSVKKALQRSTTVSCTELLGNSAQLVLSTDNGTKKVVR